MKKPSRSPESELQKRLEPAHRADHGVGGQHDLAAGVERVRLVFAERRRREARRLARDDERGGVGVRGKLARQHEAGAALQTHERARDAGAQPIVNESGQRDRRPGVDRHRPVPRRTAAGTGIRFSGRAGPGTGPCASIVTSATSAHAKL